MEYPDDGHSTAALLRDAFRWFADGIETRSAENGEPDLSPGASMMMSYLDDSLVNISDLARAMRVSRQRAHVVVRELVTAEMVHLTPNPLSRREKLVSLTSVGYRRRQRVLEALRSRDERAARSLGDAEIERLRGILIRLIADSENGDT